MERDERRLVSLILAMLLLAMGQGCGSAAMDARDLDPDDPVTDTPRPGEDPELDPNPGEELPPVTDLEPELIMLSGRQDQEYHLWGTSETDVFVAGARGLLAHFDGRRWRPFETGSSRDFAWIFGVSPRDVYVGTDIGGVFHFDGEVWNREKDLEPFSPTDLWGRAPDDIYAISGADVAHFDGQKWRRLDTELRPDSEWTAISGSGERHVVLIGHEAGSPWSPRFGYFHGAGWKELEVPVITQRLHDVWSATREDTFIVGTNGTILHFDGGSLKTMDGGTDENLHSIGGASPDDVYAGGQRSEVLHFDGIDWTSMDAPPNPDTGNLQRIWSILSFGEGRALAAGRGLHFFDRTSWGTVLPFMSEINDIWATGPDDVLLAGSATHRFDGFTLELEDFGTFEDVELRAAWGTAERTYAVATNFNEVYVHDGTGWGLMASDPASSGWLDIYGTSEDDVFVVGYEGQILHYDGSGWKPMDSGTDDSLGSVWAAAPDDVYAVGYTGSVLHYDGVEWSTFLAAHGNILPNHITGFEGEHVIAPSLYGGVYINDGVSWKPAGPDFEGMSNDILHVHGASVDELYALGYAGLLHYDGEQWTHIDPIAPGGGEQRVFAVGPREVYVSGDRGAYRFTVPSR